MKKTSPEIQKAQKAIRARQYYERNKVRLLAYRRQWAKENPEKEKRYKAAWLKRNLGRIYMWEKTNHQHRRPCEVCDSKDTQAHHEDYSKPLAVIWLCPLHHKERHRMKSTVKSASQQGDVLLRRIPELPDGTIEKIATGRCVLAHGESGHSHVVDQEGAELIRIGEQLFLVIGSQAIVRHEEHHAHTLSPGIWEIGRVKEFDYFQQMERQVMD